MLIIRVLGVSNSSFFFSFISRCGYVRYLNFFFWVLIQILINLNFNHFNNRMYVIYVIDKCKIWIIHTGWEMRGKRNKNAWMNKLQSTWLTGSCEECSNFLYIFYTSPIGLTLLWCCFLYYWFCWMQAIKCKEMGMRSIKKMKREKWSLI